MGVAAGQTLRVTLATKGIILSELNTALSHLSGVRKQGNEFIARCPCHNDRHQSLSITEKEGKLLAYCHAGCSFESIIKALNLEPKNDKLPPQIVATYDYTDSEGKLLYQVVRYHPKNFKQRRPIGNDWEWNLNGISPTLYHLPEVLIAIKEGQQVFVVEGEKDVDNLRLQGLAATTISGGASTKWPPSIIPLFQGAKIIIIPDNDTPGLKYAQYVSNLLYGWCASLKLITLPAKDVSDYLDSQAIDDEHSNPRDNLLNLCHNMGEFIPSGAVTREEFNAWRGVNQYLWQTLLRKSKGNKRYNVYKV